jgi:putative tricarboxylic transport membrane protein
MRRRNIAAAVGLIVCGLVYGILSWNLPERSLPGTPGPSFFPLVVTAMLLVLSVALLVRALVSERAAPAPDEDAAALAVGERGLAAGALAVLLAYVVLLPTLGFVLATIPFFAVLMALFGERRPIPVVAGAVAMTAILYGLFRHGLGIFLPRGLLAGIVA